ncbi:MMPL family transporter [Actinomadura sp. NEAU-AAG7]|uniref:MMPL family transporter n=1 Tax=Actinomadura sp. NEAU-AAG7 TaxID=2839640 RepID=UPI001BE3F890|nr:MMPL family transporter [Actinomadura sp. NEAU-AAG7]MBT2210857.1 MMPL family transporter [Actinomadura sp. NEAU-AAG7]
MAAILYRVGAFCFRRRRLVCGLWALLVVLTIAGAATLAGETSNTVTIPGTEAQQTLDRLNERFPEAKVGNASARVVFVAPPGQRLSDGPNQAAVEKVVQGMRKAPRVSAVLDPFQAKALSRDGRFGYGQATYDVPAADLEKDEQEALKDAAAPGRAAGLTVEFGGDAVTEKPVTGVFELIGVLVAAVVLVVTLGSMIAAGLPLVMAILGVGIGMSGVAIASGMTDLNVNTGVLALMLGLAVGIDYTLLIVSRFRHEVAERPPEEAAALAVGTAGSAVVFAGLTVMIALAGLSVVGIPVLTAMGLAAAGTVAVAVLLALTLLPALLGFAARRIAAARRGRVKPGAVPHGERWARFVIRRRIPVLLVALVGLGIAAIPAADLRLGLPDDSMLPADSTQRKAFELVSEGFGPGFNGPLVVVVDGGRGGGAAAAGQVAATIGRMDGVAAVTPPTPNRDGGIALLTVFPKTGATEQATTDLVHRIRDRRGEVRAATGASIAVTGLTAVNIDFSKKLNDALLPYLGVVVGLTFLLLMLVFRSLIVPVKAALGFLLSVAATFGAVVAVFQWGWLSSVFGLDATGPTASLLPIALIGILFGLAMDYEVFIVARMREEHVHGTAPDEAVATAFRHNARVVTAAAIIMISVFAGFLFSTEQLSRSIGFALAFGVLADALVVRMTIVPVVMSLFGRAAWWLPGWLERILPAVDVDGERLAERRDPPAGRRSEPDVAAPAG